MAKTARQILIEEDEQKQGKIFTYCRVSTLDQNLDAQAYQLATAYPSAIAYEEKKSGGSLETRVELQAVLKAIGKGDTLVVYKMERLARNTQELLTIVEDLTRKGAFFRTLDHEIDTSTANGKMFLQILAVFAEFERNNSKERQRIGIDKAKDEGKFKGKQPNKAVHNEIKQLFRQGYTNVVIHKITGASPSTITRVKRTIRHELDKV